MEAVLDKVMPDSKQLAGETGKAVVFADLTGSTKLFELQGNTVATQVVTRCTQMLDRHFTSSGGRVVKYLGDGLLVLFDHSEMAVDAASHTRDVLYEFNLEQLEHSSTQLGLKVGIEFGPVIEQQGDCYGDAVNVAARLSDRAEANEILLGEALYTCLSDSKRIFCMNLDRIAIKGKTGPVKVWRFDWRLTAETTITTPLDLLDVRVSMAQTARSSSDAAKAVASSSTTGACRAATPASSGLADNAP